MQADKTSYAEECLFDMSKFEMASISVFAVDYSKAIPR